MVFLAIKLWLIVRLCVNSNFVKFSCGHLSTTTFSSTAEAEIKKEGFSNYIIVFIIRLRDHKNRIKN